MFEINTLPPELITKIFTYLDTSDRKNIRLTCRLWNALCNCAEVIKYEKFVFRPDNGGDGLQDLGARIQECKTPRSCWEFQGVRLFQLPSVVWRNCGDRIQSLFIYHCMVDDATISNIIIHCPNLKHFRLQSVFDFDFVDDDDVPTTVDAVGFDSERVFCSKSAINRLAQRKIERRNLTSLELYIPTSLIPNKMLRIFFQIFPCIQTFAQGLWRLDAISWDTAFENNPANGWALPPMIENFISNTDDISNSWKMPNSKFKVFSSILNLNKISNYRIIYDFFAEQGNLEKLALYVCKGGSYDGVEMIIQILKKTLNLKELEFHSDHSLRFTFTPEQLNDFFVLTSKLESIKTNYGFHVNGPLPSLPLTEYSKLKRLNLGSTENNVAFEILKRCNSSLQHLSLDWADDKVLQIIFEAHTELRSLHIRLGDLSGEEGSTHKKKKYPFSKLKNLEHFSLRDIDPVILKSTLSEFVFPKLKYFDFYCRDWTKYMSFDDGPPFDNGVKVFGIMLAVVCKSAPRLEILRLRSCLYKADDFEKLFRNTKMKYLRFIIIDNLMSMYNSWFESDERNLPLDRNFGYVDRVFNECPSLRLINFYRLGRYTFSYDRSSKKVKRHSLFFNACNAVQP